MWLSMTAQKLFLPDVSDVSVLLSSFLAEIVQGTELRDLLPCFFISNGCRFVSKCSNETEQLPDGKINK